VSVHLRSSKDADHLAFSFDVDLPTDCDDEYWENDDPNLAFKQPPGKPSKVAFFISLIKQQEILALALRTIVGSSRGACVVTRAVR
jgi:hypothetical protein